MRIWNPTQVDISDRRGRLLGTSWAVMEADVYGTSSWTYQTAITGGAVGNSPAVKLENQAGTGRVVYVERIEAEMSVAGVMYVKAGVVHEAGDADAAVPIGANRRVGSAGASLALLHQIANSASPGVLMYAYGAVPVNTRKEITVPYSILEGNGILIVGAAIGAQTLRVTFSWREEAI